MGAVVRGTFVLSMRQIEVDGQVAPPPLALVAGAAWRWRGEAVRLDGPAEGAAGAPLRLPPAIGVAALRQRAARRAARLLGPAGPWRQPAATDPDGDGDLVVGDGRRRYPARLAGPPEAPLLVFAEGLPPAGRTHWIVRGPAALPAASAAPLPPSGVAATALVETAAGPRPAGALSPGDRLPALDGRPCAVTACASQRLSGARLHVTPALRPVRLRGGALAAGRPGGGLLVAPGQAVAVAGPAVQALFAVPMVLAAAADLAGCRGIAVDHAAAGVTYVGLTLDRPAVIRAAGFGLACPGTGAGDGDLRRLTAAEAAILRHGLPG
jgi:hypothetical protein